MASKLFNCLNYTEEFGKYPKPFFWPDLSIFIFMEPYEKGILGSQNSGTNFLEPNSENWIFSYEMVYRWVFCLQFRNSYFYFFFISE